MKPLDANERQAALAELPLWKAQAGRDAIEVVARSIQFLSPRGDDAGAEVVPFEAAVA